MQSSIKTSPLNEKDKEILKMATLQSQFPVEFKKGMTYTTIKARCVGCKDILADEDVHGEVKPVLENMFQLEARGYCPKCNIFSPISYRLYSDGRVMGIMNGKWMTFQMKSEMPLWRKILKFLFW
jgi:hypothetical protein